MVKERYKDMKTKGNGGLNVFLCEWLQDKSWGHMIVVIDWEKTMREQFQQKEQWLIPSQVRNLFKSKAFADKIMAFCEKNGKTRPHPNIPEETQYLVDTEDSHAIQDETVRRVAANLKMELDADTDEQKDCLLYTSPSPRD